MRPFLLSHVPQEEFTFQVSTDIWPNFSGSLFNWIWFTFEVLSVHFSSSADIKSRFRCQSRRVVLYLPVEDIFQQPT
jgi:hypothetical protein